MSPRMKFQKALLLLDKGEAGRAEKLLAEVVCEAEGEGDKIALVQGLVCLGELLHLGGRNDEALPLLRRASTMRRDDDLLAEEFDIADDIVKEVTGKS